MLLSDWFLERREKRIQAARAEGYAKGYAQGYAAAKTENGDAVKESPDSSSSLQILHRSPQKSPNGLI